MAKPIRHEPHFFGATTLGEKGQVVIPAEARAALGLKKGDKLLVLGMGPGQLALSTLAGIERFVSHMTSRLDAMRDLSRNLDSKHKDTKTPR
jgi:AbrB family looped-hinge helix DNA binding protein